jgi:hypothetical protein
LQYPAEQIYKKNLYLPIIGKEKGLKKPWP